MIKPQRLKAGDKIAIVSLSSGVLGETFAAHELELGEKRLKEFGLQPVYMPNAKKGIAYIKDHPEARAADLKQAFKDPAIRGIVCAVGGDDTYRTIPYLLDDPEFVETVKNNPRVFLGYSDTTNNHLMFYKLGLQTYYGQAFLTDLAELADDMLPYSKEWFEELLAPSQAKEMKPSPAWYEEREGFGPEQVGVKRVSHPESRGFEVLRGTGTVTGELLGGCIESLYDQLTGERYAAEKTIIKEYGIFPSKEEWQGKIFFAETSEEKPNPDRLSRMLRALDRGRVFAGVNAVLVGKPLDEEYYEELKDVWLAVTKKYDLPIMYNLNFGHAYPHGILPYGGKVQIDFDQKKVYLQEPLVG